MPERDYKIRIRFFFTREKMAEVFRAANIQISEPKTWYVAGA